jgi:hypothetical protein
MSWRLQALRSDHSLLHLLTLIPLPLSSRWRKQETRERKRETREGKDKEEEEIEAKIKD